MNKRAMAELRHSSSIGNRATPSPTASAVASSPLSSDFRPSPADDDDHDLHTRYRSLRSCFQSFIPSDDLYRPHAYGSNFSIFILVSVAPAAMIAFSSLVRGLNAPYFCRKDGVTLHCPHVKESSSLWENPLSATASWKPCAERREVINSDLPAENESNGYVFIHAEDMQRSSCGKDYECYSYFTCIKARSDMKRPNVSGLN